MSGRKTEGAGGRDGEREGGRERERGGGGGGRQRVKACTLILCQCVLVKGCSPALLLKGRERDWRQGDRGVEREYAHEREQAHERVLARTRAQIFLCQCVFSKKRSLVSPRACALPMSLSVWHTASSGNLALVSSRMHFLYHPDQ